MTAALQVVDFHNHYVGPAFPLTTRFREDVQRRLRDPAALLSSLDEGGVSARVVNTPLEFVQDAAGRVALGTIERMNDALAALVHQHPRRLFGLATVDAYAGDAAGTELSRAVKSLGLRGVFVESAKDGWLPDASQARSTFAAAAALGVPVFLHPVADRELDARFKRFGPLGVRLTRGTINSAALVAILQSGMLEELPSLRIVVTALAVGGVLLAAGAPGLRNVYVDTTGMNGGAIRAAIEVLGADHVVAGTDWPVVQENSLATRLLDIVPDPQERRLIAHGNAHGLLGLEP